MKQRALRKIEGRYEGNPQIKPRPPQICGGRGFYKMLVFREPARVGPGNQAFRSWVERFLPYQMMTPT